MLRPAKRYSPTAPLCHSTKPGENKLGPSLAGVFGRKSGTEPGYTYSSALKAQNVTWDEASLEACPRMRHDSDHDERATAQMWSQHSGLTSYSSRLTFTECPAGERRKSILAEVHHARQ
jgi:hypothetical protein